MQVASRTKNIEGTMGIISDSSPSVDRPRRIPVRQSVRLRASPSSSTSYYTGNSSLQVCPLGLPRQRHIPNIIHIQLPVAPTHRGAPPVFVIPLELVNGTTLTNRGRNDRNLHGSNKITTRRHSVSALPMQIEHDIQHALLYPS